MSYMDVHGVPVGCKALRYVPRLPTQSAQRYEHPCTSLDDDQKWSIPWSLLTVLGACTLQWSHSALWDGANGGHAQDCSRKGSWLRRTQQHLDPLGAGIQGQPQRAGVWLERMGMAQNCSVQGPQIELNKNTSTALMWVGLVFFLVKLIEFLSNSMKYKRPRLWGYPLISWIHKAMFLPSAFLS